MFAGVASLQLCQWVGILLLGFLGFAIGQGGHSRIGSFDSVAISVGTTVLKIRVHRTKKNRVHVKGLRISVR